MNSMRKSKITPIEENAIIPESIVPVPEEPIDSGDYEPVDDPDSVSETPAKLDNNEPKNQKRVKLKFRTKQNDIGYKAPLSYRYLRILGWVSLAIAQLGLVFRIAVMLDPAGEASYTVASSAISYVASLPLALFMLANFGIILRNRRNFKYLFVFYGGIMLGMYVLANIVVLHYVYGTMRALNPEMSFQDVALFTGTFLTGAGTTGYIFNLFVDLFLCVATVFFFFYTPKSKHLQGKKVIWFRLLVILPIAYELVSIVIKSGALQEKILVPSYLFFLLTSKPPLTFVAFFIITLIVKIREHKFLKKYNYDYELLREHEQTNAHSFRTSITIAVVFAVISTLDIFAFFGYVVFQIIKIGTEDSVFQAFDLASQLGLGGSIPLILIAPLALLYSYTKVHKNKKLDSFLPIIGIGLIVFTIVEGIYLTLRINLSQMMNAFIGSMEGMEGMEEGMEGLEGLEGLEEAGEETLEAIKRAATSFINIWR